MALVLEQGIFPTYVGGERSAWTWGLSGLKQGLLRMTNMVRIQNIPWLLDLFMSSRLSCTPSD